MLYKKIVSSILALFILSVLICPTKAKGQILDVANEYSPEELFLKVYADGKVDVEYTVSVDPLLASVEIHLLGEFYEGLLVVDDNGFPLDYSILDNGVIVDTLGSQKVRLYYTTADLTSKVGRIWTVYIASPITFTVRLPVDAAIVAVSAAPVSLWVVGGHYYLKMPSGEQEISYIIGAIGSKERAITLIDQVGLMIEEAKNKGLDVAQAEVKLDSAKLALEEGKFGEAELLATEAKQLVEQALAEIPVHSPTASPSIPVVPTQPASELLWVLLGITGMAVFVVAVVFLRSKRKISQPKVRREFRFIDVKKLLEKKRHLGLMDREAIEFIGSAGGEVFEAELREKFKLPKSTAWRMVKRLKKEGIVEVEKVGGQNLIRLIEQ